MATKITSSMSYHFLGFDNVAELLIQKGADVNIAGEIGNRALTHSAEKGKLN